MTQLVVNTETFSVRYWETKSPVFEKEVVIKDVVDVKVQFTEEQKVMFFQFLEGRAAMPPKNIDAAIFENLTNLEIPIMATKKTTSTKTSTKKKAIIAKKKASIAKKTSTKKKAAPAKRTGACAKVHEIADTMYKKDKDVARKDVIEACVKADINKATAATQYQKWSTLNFTK